MTPLRGNTRPRDLELTRIFRRLSLSRQWAMMETWLIKNNPAIVVSNQRVQRGRCSEGATEHLFLQVPNGSFGGGGAAAAFKTFQLMHFLTCSKRRNHIRPFSLTTSAFRVAGAAQTDKQQFTLTHSYRNGKKFQGFPPLPKLSYEGKIKLKVCCIATRRFKNREGETSHSSSCD